MNLYTDLTPFFTHANAARTLLADIEEWADPS